MSKLALLVPLPLLLGLSAWGSARAADAGGTALGAALSAVAAVIGSEQAPADEEPDADATVPVSTLALDDTVASLSGSSGTKSKARRATAAKAPTIFVSADRVLRLAESRVTPRGVRVPADGTRPAGLRLVGVEALGIGLRDGDVLTRALGQPALSSSAVVRAVLVARAQHVKVLEGEFYRGRERWVLRVEQPYLDDQRTALTWPAPGPRLSAP